MKTNVVRFKPSAKVAIDWTDSYVVCQLLQQEIAVRLQNRIKINKMAVDTGISGQTISKIGYGITKEPRASTVLRLLHYFGYKVTIHS